LSTITDSPSTLPSSAASTLAFASIPPAGVAGTTILSGLLAGACAWEKSISAEPKAAAASVAAQLVRFAFMRILLALTDQSAGHPRGHGDLTVQFIPAKPLERCMSIYNSITREEAA
jgi:hypothetical protein